MRITDAVRKKARERLADHAVAGVQTVNFPAQWPIRNIDIDGEVAYECLPDLGKYRKSGGFGDWYTVDGRSYQHRGYDGATPIGVKLVAPAPGTVVIAGAQGTFGNAVTIEHDYGVYRYTIIAHMDQVSVKVGQRVKAFDQIGISGATGLVTGPHYHMQRCRVSWMSTDISWNVDPLKYLIPEKDMKAIEDIARKLDQQEELLCKIATVVAGDASGRDFASIQEALAVMQRLAASDSIILLGLGYTQSELLDHTHDKNGVPIRPDGGQIFKPKVGK